MWCSGHKMSFSTFPFTSLSFSHIDVTHQSNPALMSRAVTPPTVVQHSCSCIDQALNEIWKSVLAASNNSQLLEKCHNSIVDGIKHWLQSRVLSITRKVFEDQNLKHSKKRIVYYRAVIRTSGMRALKGLRSQLLAAPQGTETARWLQMVKGRRVCRVKLVERAAECPT